MHILPKHKNRSIEQIGRQRPPATSQPQPHAFSYHANRSTAETNTGRMQEVVVRRRGRRGLLSVQLRVILLGVVSIGIILSQLVLSASPKVMVLSNAGSSIFLRDTATYSQAATKQFTNLGNRNKLTVNTAAISGALKRQFPELGDVSVTLPIFGRQAVVYIQPSDPSFIVHTANGNFVLDGAGRALVSITSAQMAMLHVPVITDESGLQANVADIVLPGNEVAFMQTILRQLEAQHIGVGKIVLPPAASEVDIYVGSKSYFAKFNMQDQNGATQQAGALMGTLDALSKQGKMPVRYIDVRTDGRTYYK